MNLRSMAERLLVAFVCGLTLFIVSQPCHAQPRDSVLFDDGLPPGAISLSPPSGVGADGWNWVRGDPQSQSHWVQADGSAQSQASTPMPFSGARAHSSAAKWGPHMHGFSSATGGLPIDVGDTLVSYVYIDPANVPAEIMIRWIPSKGASPTTSRWAYWSAGPNIHPLKGLVSGGSATWVGALPAAGRWVRLEVPASSLSLEGKSVYGMAFYLQHGGATWDRAGKIGTAHASWIEDDTPAGSILSETGDSWAAAWVTSPLRFSGLRAHQSENLAGLHEHGFIGPADSGIPVDVGESMVCYVYLDPASPPRELMLSWYAAGSFEHRAYWGDDLINAGISDTASRWYVGPLPPRGQWVRLEVPASLVSLEGKSVTGMRFTLYDGRARFDHAGTGPGRVEDEFVGPFSSWKDVKAEYGAVGDGKADDTAAIQQAFDDLRNHETLYFPAGTYKITDTLYLGRKYVGYYSDPPTNQQPVYFEGRVGIGIIGEDPMTTTIKWASSRPTGVFRWDGVNGKFVNGLPVPMLDVEGVGHSKFSRITWDGAGPEGNADIGVFQHNGSGTYFATNMEHSDEVFRDLAYGIVGGLQLHAHASAPQTAEWPQGVAETTVIRTQFLRCSQAGAFMGAFNSVNWWFRECYFSGCKMGVATNTRTSASDPSGLWAPGELSGAGDFHVHNSLFRKSSYADLHHVSTSFFSFRGNTSVGSRQFFTGGIVTQNPLMIHGNIILDTVQANAIEVASSGPVLMVDNIVRSLPQSSGPALNLFTYASRDLGVMTVGNTFTTPQPVALQVAGADGAFPEGQPDLPALWYGAYDDRAGVTAALEPWPVTSFPGPSRKFARPEIVVANVPGQDMTGAIQTALDAANDPANVSYYRKHTVVKLLGGKDNGGERELYDIGGTIQIANGSDVQLAGAGELSTCLRWQGAPGSVGPIVRVQGRTEATLRDMTLEGDGMIDANDHVTPTSVTGLRVELSDRAESRLMGDQLFVSWSYAHSLVSAGLDRAAIELHGFEHASAENATSVEVRGGPLLAGGSTAATGRTSIFGGASSYIPRAFDVRDKGHLLVADSWCENHVHTTYMSSSHGSGEFTMSGNLIAVGNTEDFLPMVPQFQFDTFRGKITLVTTFMLARFGIEFLGDGSQTRSLINVAASNFDTEQHLYFDPQFVFDDGSTPATISILGSHVRSSTLLHYLAPNSGPHDSASVRDLLTQLRSERSALPSSPWTPSGGATPTASHVQIHRVLVTKCNDGVIVEPAP
jgi:hypothetical protein